MIVLLSGSRHAGEAHWPTIEARLLTVVGDPLGEHTLREGEAKGVDRIGARLAESWGWTVERFPAAWGRCAPNVPEELGGCPPRPHLRLRRGGTYCPNAGPLRNQRMVDRQPRADVAACFPAVGCRGRSGTWDLAARAADAGIPVHLFPLAVDIPAATPLPYPQPEEA